jgi:endonuclease YncB( thermonuclease family)
MNCNPLLAAIGLPLAQPAMVDGDTLQDGDERYRVENIDATERGARAECPEERAKPEAPMFANGSPAHAASKRTPRAIATAMAPVVARMDGVDRGERLIARGLAQLWRGRKAKLCRSA